MIAGLLKQKPKAQASRKRRKLEEPHQRAFFWWFRTTYRDYKDVCFHVPNGGLRNKAEAMLFKLAGVQAGIPDIFCLVPSDFFHGLIIEMKPEKKNPSRISNEQKAKIARFNELGYCAMVCYGFEDAREQTIKYMSHVRKPS